MSGAAALPTALLPRHCSQVTFGFEFAFGIRARLNLGAEVKWLVKGEMLLDASIMQLQLVPKLTVDCKQGGAKGGLYASFEPLVISVATALDKLKH